MEAESNSRPWESEAKEAAERAVRAEVEIDVARHEWRWLDWISKRRAMPGHRWNMS